MLKKKFKIAITGPESTGKSTLCSLLASHYQASVSFEYARDYLLNHPYPLTVEEIQLIHDRQLEQEAALFKQTNTLLFCDTDLFNFKIWLQEGFNQSPEWIHQSIAQNTYDLYLLCFPDVEWVPDGIRANQHNRILLYEQFLTELMNAHQNVAIIKGLGDERLKNSIAAVDDFRLRNMLG